MTIYLHSAGCGPFHHGFFHPMESFSIPRSVMVKLESIHYSSGGSAMATPTYAVYNPVTLEIIGEAPQHTEDDVRRAMKRAHESTVSWASDREARRASLRQIAGLVRSDAGRLGRILSLEQGKVLAEAI